ncbi:hypothetical protein QE152_g8033 [Popillia japonica]|uniref:Uncharacterized protein n=1 Tax=Popillia japonica TaxID=7064 RepID=A0AAW1MCZ3_POPJA
MEQVYRSQLKNRSQKSTESLQEYQAEVFRLTRCAYPTVPDEVNESLAIDKFLDGLRDIETQQAVKLARPKTLKEALSQALEFKAVKQSIRSQARDGEEKVIAYFSKVLSKPERSLNLASRSDRPADDLSKVTLVSRRIVKFATNAHLLYYDQVSFH